MNLIIKIVLSGVLCWILSVFSTETIAAEKICDHEVVLDDQGRLLPWTSYDQIIRWSMNFIKHCPTIGTKFGDDPWYLVSAKYNEDGNFLSKQNNQGSNVYWGMETLKKYYAYTGDKSAVLPIKRLIERVVHYHTPQDWAWPNVPRTKDDTPDGEYTDEVGEVDKLCMVALGYIGYFKMTGEALYLNKAMDITRTLLNHLSPGDESHSPFPFRVNFRTNEILDPYSSNMILAIQLLDEWIAMAIGSYKRELQQTRNVLWNWIVTYPLRNNWWSGYYEDVVSDYNNLNQQTPMETARYLLRHPEMDPDYKTHAPALIRWVENRFGRTKRFGATSIVEQDSFFMEMSSHTARYASVVAMWYGVTQNPDDREEARAAFALSTYSAYNQYSKDSLAFNYVGIGYTDPWFSDSYWDYLSHYFDGMKELPEMLPQDENHLFYSSSIIDDITYSANKIRYSAFDPHGIEMLKLTFTPMVFSDGQPLPESQWEFGDYRGVTNILTIKRSDEKYITIKVNDSPQ